MTPPSSKQLIAALRHLAAEHKKKDMALRTLPDMVHAVADHLGVPHEQVEPRREDIYKVLREEQIYAELDVHRAF